MSNLNLTWPLEILSISLFASSSFSSAWAFSRSYRWKFHENCQKFHVNGSSRIAERSMRPKVWELIMVNDLILILQFCLVLRNIVLQLFFVLFETFHHLREFHNNIGQDVILCLERPASFSHIFCAHLRRLPPHSEKNNKCGRKLDFTLAWSGCCFPSQSGPKHSIHLKVLHRLIFLLLHFRHLRL